MPPIKSQSATEDPPTRTAGTLRAYRRRADALTQRAALDIGADDPSVDPLTVADWLIRQKPTLTKATFRQYRAALIATWEPFTQQHAIYQEAIRRLSAEPQTGALQPRTGSTSSRKAKRIPERDLAQLCAELDRRNSVWARRAKIFLLANVVGGPRLAEWTGATLDDDMLILENAKHTNGRGHGPQRAWAVYGDELLAIQAQLNEIYQWRAANGLMEDHAAFCERFEHIYIKNCREALHRARSHLWGQNPNKRYCLSSGRHQFAANMKNLLNDEEVAYRMGHGSVRTARRSYGRRAAGHSRFKNTNTATASNKRRNRQSS